MNENVKKIEKRLGETPLEALERFRADHPQYVNLPMTYAGRLDPMAEGELLILIGEECKNKEAYTGLDKEYEFEILFGFTTDTYDLLGLSEPAVFSQGEAKENLGQVLLGYSGKQIQTYPPYSSKTVDGVPLFQKTRNKEEVELPERGVEIYNIELLGFREISGKDIFHEIKRRIALVRGDFRQHEIIARWNENLSHREEESFLIASVRMKCSSGTYVRAMVHNLPFPAVTFSIKRTRIFDDETIDKS